MARSSSETTDVPKRAPRRRVTKVAAKTPTAPEPTIETAPPRRRAPTQLRTETVERSQSVRRLRVKTYVPIGVLVFGFGVAALIGYSDDGQINISEVVSQRNAEIVKTANESGATAADQITIPVQNNVSTAPDGGLISSGAVPPPPPPPPEVASTTEEVATSTDSTATTSEAIGEVTPDSSAEIAVLTEEVTPVE